jgi:Bacterial SH3 domain
MRATVGPPGLNLRVQPNVYSKIKYALNHDEVVVLMGSPNRWGWQMVKVERTGDYGYVDAHYLKIFMVHQEPKPPETIPSVEPRPPLPMPKPIDDVGAPNKDTSTVIITAIILAAFVAMLFWTMLSGKSL